MTSAVTSKLVGSMTRPFVGLDHKVWLLGLSMLINRAGSMLIAFMSLYLTSELGYSNSQAGLVMACYGTGSIIGSYLGGWITDRRGYYDVIVGSLIVSGLTIIPLLWVKNIYLVSAIVFLYAVIADSFRPANTVAVSNFSTSENRTRSISLMRLAINLGFAIGPAIGGIVAKYYVFKYIFVYDAATSIIAGLILLYYLPRKENIRKKEDAKPVIEKSSSAFFDLPYMLFLLLVAIYGTLFFQLFASVPVFMDQVFHYEKDIIGYLLGLNGLIVCVMEMPLIYYLEKNKRPSLYLFIGCIMMVIAYTLLSLNYSALWISIVYTFFITFSEMFAMPFMMNYVIERPKQERKGQYIALYSVAYGVSHIVAPSLGLGYSEKFGFIEFYILISVASLVLGFAFYYFMKKNPNPVY